MTKSSVDLHDLWKKVRVSYILRGTELGFGGFGL